MSQMSGAWPFLEQKRHSIARICQSQKAEAASSYKVYVKTIKYAENLQVQKEIVCLA